MANLQNDQPARYCIKVQGKLDARWSDWLNASTLHVTRDPAGGPVTTFTGQMPDQAALYGCLSRLRDLGLPLLLVQYLEESRSPPEPNAMAETRPPDDSKERGMEG